MWVDFLNPRLLYPYTGSTPRFVRLVSVVEVACGHGGNTSLATTAGKVQPFLINYRQIVGYGPVNDRLLVTAQSTTIALGTYRTRSAVYCKMSPSYLCRLLTKMQGQSCRQDWDHLIKTHWVIAIASLIYLVSIYFGSWQTHCSI